MPKATGNLYRGVNPPHHGSVAYAFDFVEEGAEAFRKYGSRLAYSRMGDPDVAVFESWLAEFEGTTSGSVWATNTGMTAIALSLKGMTSRGYGNGKRVVAPCILYGGTHHLLCDECSEGNIDLTWVEDPFSLTSWEKAICDGDSPPALVLVESPSNPNADLIDISELASIVHKNGSRLVVDNTLGVGLVRPLELGADGVIYSVTKAINRMSSGLGGAVVVSPEFRLDVEEIFDNIFVHYGMIMNPNSALEAFKGRTTLRRDMELFSKNALCAALFLEEHPQVASVYYPLLASSPHFDLATRQMPRGAGGVLSFELKSHSDAIRFVEGQTAAYLAVHLGDSNNDFVTHPASTTHQSLSVEERQALGITGRLVRVSVSLKGEEEFGEVLEEYKRVLDSLDS